MEELKKKIRHRQGARQRETERKNSDGLQDR